jgi:hypothetical protein
MITLEVDERLLINDIIFEPKLKGNKLSYSFVFKPRALTEFTFISLYDSEMVTLTDIENITRIIIYRNNSVIFDGTILVTPLIFNANDAIKVKVYKNASTTGSFKLIGNTE